MSNSAFVRLFRDRHGGVLFAVLRRWRDLYLVARWEILSDQPLMVAAFSRTELPGLSRDVIVRKTNTPLRDAIAFAQAEARSATGARERQQEDAHEEERRRT